MNSAAYKYVRVAYKIIFALVAFWAVENEITTLVARHSFAPLNFFSFFTIQSNVFAAVMLIMGAAALLARKQSRSIDALRGASTLYMALTGVVFAVLLAGLKGVALTAVPVDNTILHYVMPIVLIIDWLLDEPHYKLAKRAVALWLIYPVAYLVYTMIRGAVAHWYPYPFLNPTHGYGPVAGTCIVIAAGVVAAGFLVRLRSVATIKNGRLARR